MPSYRKFEVHTISTDFRAATHVVQVAELPLASPGHVVVKNHYVGINASDMYMTSGQIEGLMVPFGLGSEAVGEIVAVGEGVVDLHVGDAVAYLGQGTFSEYVVIYAATAIKIPAIDPSALPAMVSGMSASIALEQAGRMASGERVLVTAAAGGAGQIAVQLAKLAGNHVIGTTSSDAKAAVLKSIGCDRVINYNKESVDEVLKREYPAGVDLVFETVGGDMVKPAVQNLAAQGRLLVFGRIAGTVASSPKAQYTVDELTADLMERCASMTGFKVLQHMELMVPHQKRLLQLIAEGTLQPGIDSTEFKGLEAIVDAVEYMYARKNSGKLVVKLV